MTMHYILERIDKDETQIFHAFESWRNRYKLELIEASRRKESKPLSALLLQHMVNDENFHTYLKKELEKTFLQFIEANADVIQVKRTKGSVIYEKLKNELEKKYMGKFVAIDLNKEAVVGIGNTIDEAYEDATSKSDNKKFYFRKVGQDYLFRI